MKIVSLKNRSMPEAQCPALLCVLCALCASALSLNAQLTTKSLAMPAQTNLLLSWVAPPIYIPVFSSTNLLATNWTRITNLYPVWPTNCLVPVAATPSQFYRIGIQSGTNLYSWNSVTATN